MSKGVRVYLGKKRFCYNDTFGVRVIDGLTGFGWKIKAIGCEEGAMTVHLEKTW